MNKDTNNICGTPTERYPDQLPDEELYKNLLDLPDGTKIHLDFVKNTVWDEAVSFSVPKDKVVKGMQANMFSIVMTNSREKRVSVMVKRVVPRELPKKPSHEVWLAFIQSVRREIDFYADLLSAEHEPVRNLFPRVYFSSGTPPSLDNDPLHTAFIIIMDDLTENFFQTPMMNQDQARLVLDSMAKLHAHYWDKLDGEDRGGFWVLERRKVHGEIEEAETTWNSFVDRFPELEKSVEGVRQLGKMVRDKAEEMDGFVERGACTRIHGDAKGWNFFFGKEGASQPFLLIDLQWTGRGHPLQDVAYALTTTSDEDTLSKMDLLVDYYVERLKEELFTRNINIDASLLRDEYDTVWLDYVRVIVMGLWRRLDNESINKNKTKIGPSMINRSWPHVLFIVNRLKCILRETPHKLNV